MQRDTKLGKVGQEAFLQQRLEILVALSKLGETVRVPTRSKEFVFLDFLILLVLCSI
jgi:hypothetical protein